MPSVNYKTHHLLPRLRESPEAAAGYIAASLQDNIDSPESIALAFQDVAEAYALPIDVLMKPAAEHQRLQSAVVEAAKARRVAEKKFDKRRSSLADLAQLLMLAELAEDEAVDALMVFEAEHKIGSRE